MVAPRTADTCIDLFRVSVEGGGIGRGLGLRQWKGGDQKGKDVQEKPITCALHWPYGHLRERDI